VVSNCSESTNTLTWARPVADSCGKDIAGYYIYYTPATGTPKLFDSVPNPNDTTYLHRLDHTIVGCYGVAAYDSVGNVSAMSNIICIDINDGSECLYRLPNLFSPNGDGKNDYFIPFPYTSVNSVAMKIFDRWGRIVFETGDPDIRWDGKDKTTSQPCSDGTYFYVCDVSETTLSGPVSRTLKGSVTILR
jgi:gliding motility-associated-like protein